MKRKYRGKYPNRICTISCGANRWSLNTEWSMTIIVNSGRVLRFTREQAVETFGLDMPKLGFDMSDIIAARDAIVQVLPTGHGLSFVASN